MLKLKKTKELYMHSFLEPIKIATIIFPIVAFMITVPFLIYQYRKKGYASFYYSFLIFLFIYYLMNAYFLVILPLPPIYEVNTTYTEMMQLVPFQFIFDIARESSLNLIQPNTYLKALKEPVVTQVLYNIVMVIPFGVFMRYLFKKDLKQTLIYSLLLSLFFEISQLSGLFFIYSGPYRLFDVDDLILNTLGGVLGYAITPYLAYFAPSIDKLDSKLSDKAKRVSLTKRIIYLLIDVFIINFISSILSLITSINLDALIFILYFTILPLIYDGYTIGSKFLSIQLTTPNQSLTISNTLTRSLMVYFLVLNSGNVINFLTEIILDVTTEESLIFLVFYIIIIGIWLLFNFIYYLFVLIKKPNRLYFDHFSNTYLKSTYMKKDSH